jgi:serine/threonine-protein kinase
MPTATSVPPEIPEGIPRAGETVAGKYRVTAVMGVGGMGVVVEAMHTTLDERVAIKFLRPDVVDEQETRSRFFREARACIKIRSEHVVRVLDVGELESRVPFIVMEYLEGRDLERIVRKDGPLPPHDAASYVLQACEAVAEAHALGIVHRDLKPANLFLTKRADGTPCVKVLDFGISKLVPTQHGTQNLGLTSTSAVMGSPIYMSPEQMRASRDVDARTDIWSLGTILFEVLTGEAPFKGNTMPELCASILQDETPPLRDYRLDVPPGLELVIRTCLQKRPVDRYQDVGEFARALADVVGPEGEASRRRVLGVMRKVASDPRMPVSSRTPQDAPSGSRLPLSGTDTNWTGAALGGSRRARLALLVAAAASISILLVGVGLTMRRSAAPRPQEAVAPPPLPPPTASAPATAIATTTTPQNAAPAPSATEAPKPSPPKPTTRPTATATATATPTTTPTATPTTTPTATATATATPTTTTTPTPTTTTTADFSGRK